MVNGKQLTVIWHVDDLKISHADPEAVTQFIKKLKDQYRKEAPLTIQCGKVHDYIGMCLDFRTQGKEQVDMTKYVQEIVDASPTDFAGEISTQAANHLFDVNESSQHLMEKDAVLFHHLVYTNVFFCVNREDRTSKPSWPF